MIMESIECAIVWLEFAFSGLLEIKFENARDVYNKAMNIWLGQISLRFPELKNLTEQMRNQADQGEIKSTINDEHFDAYSEWGVFFTNTTDNGLHQLTIKYS